MSFVKIRNKLWNQHESKGKSLDSRITSFSDNPQSGLHGAYDRYHHGEARPDLQFHIIPQTTGTYYFWIASDDNSQLWLSPNSDPATKVMIASLSGYANWHEWNKYSSQKSGPINLTAGVRYYVEVLHNEGNENDNLLVDGLRRDRVALNLC